MPSDGLTVAVTGPTGDIGLAVVDALERARSVKRIVGMARSPFDPAAHGWRKTEYRRGDVRDRESLRSTTAGADVLIHLAFSLMGEGADTYEINVEGSRRAFEAAVEAGVSRIVYASSVAAYGFHADNPSRLTEDAPARGSAEFFYSRQKAEVEQVLADVLASRPHTVAYVLRPCIVAGPRAQMLLEELPYYRLSEAMPARVRTLLGSMPVLRPVLPDPGTRFQLVHERDVASAFVACARGTGDPGPYNLAGPGTVQMADVARELGWYSVPVPPPAFGAAADVVTRIPGAPEAVSWLHSVRRPVLMRTERARSQLRWRPRYAAKTTLRELVASRRREATER